MTDLNNLFDTSKPFVKGIIDYTGQDRLPDYLFERACDDYGISEEKAMGLLIASTDYEFKRVDEGWLINARSA